MSSIRDNTAIRAEDTRVTKMQITIADRKTNYFTKNLRWINSDKASPFRLHLRFLIHQGDRPPHSTASAPRCSTGQRHLCTPVSRLSLITRSKILWTGRRLRPLWSCGRDTRRERERERERGRGVGQTGHRCCLGGGAPPPPE